MAVNGRYRTATSAGRELEFGSIIQIQVNLLRHKAGLFGTAFKAFIITSNERRWRKTALWFECGPEKRIGLLADGGIACLTWKMKQIGDVRNRVS